MCMSITCLIQAHNIISKVCTTCGCHDFDTTQVFADLNTDLTDL